MPQEVLCTLMYVCLFAGGRPPRKLGCDWWQRNAFYQSWHRHHYKYHRISDSHGLCRRSQTHF
jgi:hypothetical protein